jgi:hypothetical protein
VYPPAVVTRASPKGGLLTRLIDGTLRRGSDLATDFSSQDRYFKVQAGLVVGWLLISLITIGAVAHSGSSGNRLGAEVRAEQAVGGALLFVSNTSDSRWTDITYRLNGDYTYRQATLAPGDHAALPVGRFRKGGITGSRAPQDLAPQTLTISCRQGSTEIKF